MGYFRKHKRSDHNADECRKRCRRLLDSMAATEDTDQIEVLAHEWAEYRELLARHEGNNASDVD